MSAELDETPERHRWSFTGHRVTQLCIDPRSIRFHSWSLQASLDVRISAPFVLRQADGDSRTIDPREPEQLAPLLTLVGRTIDSLAIERGVALSMEFSDGTSCHVTSHPRIQAFDVLGGGALEGMEYHAQPEV